MSSSCKHTTCDSPLCSFQLSALHLVLGVNTRVNELAGASQGPSTGDSSPSSVPVELNSISDNEHGVAGVIQPICAALTSSPPITNHVSDFDADISLVAQDVVSNSSLGHGVWSTSEQDSSQNSLSSATDNSEDIQVQPQLQGLLDATLNVDGAGSTLPSDTTNVHSMITGSKRV
ncbi:hypothetical protein V6N13_142089 [Hibiscus sabdariffa]